MPRIGNSPIRRLAVNELSGGVNYRDGISLVKDDQLTDCLNVEYKNGMLRPRPAFRCTEGDDIVLDEYKNTDKLKIYAKKEWFRVIDGETWFLTVIQDSGGLDFRYCCDDRVISLAAISADELPDAEFTCNIFQYGGDIYCICSGYYARPADYGSDAEWTPYYIFKIYTDDAEVWQYIRLRDKDMYSPTIVINGVPDTPSVSGNSLEGYNLLTNNARLYYSYGTITSRAETKLYIPAPEIGSTIKVTFTSLLKNTTVTHTVLVNEMLDNVEDGMLEDGKPFPTDDQLCLVLKNDTLVNKQYITFYYAGIDPKDTEGVWQLLPYQEGEDGVLLNNVEVVMKVASKESQNEKNCRIVLDMTTSEWFGGGAEGLYGGIHLFLGGNTSEKDKALVCWSDMGKPLYFSEGGYAYVGDKAQRVTAFGKQGESLIIFKERETYATKYVSASSVISADSVISRSVIDVTVSEVTFPMTQVHGYIGCDCPDTVQLCRNRLVWAHSDGKIYTLVSANQYNERSIFETSAMVESRIKAEDLRHALSADYDGKYLLLAGENIYVMDYNSYGYSSIAYYSKEEDAQLNIPWWVWRVPDYPLYKNHLTYTETAETPIRVVSMLTVGDKLYLWAEVSTVKGPEEYYTEYKFSELFTVGGEKDRVPDIQFNSDPDTTEQFRTRELSERAIPCAAATKFFDFGGPTVRKAVPKTEMSFGNNGGIPVRVTVVTESGESTVEVVPWGENTDRRSPGYFECRAIRNENRISRMIGYRIESEGGIALGGISLLYKALG